VCVHTGDVDAAAERNMTSLRRRRKRSVSVERNVETLIVVDPSMMDYYKNENIENYVLTIMNMVLTPRNSHLYWCRSVITLAHLAESVGNVWRPSVRPSVCPVGTYSM